MYLRSNNGGSTALKRLVDVVGATLGLVVFGPTIAVAAAAIVVVQGRPVFFTQLRPGRGGRLFRIYKLRTMVAPVEGQSDIHSDKERLTPLGKWLRKSSIDELPQFFNVLRGDMSLVGPRPLLVEYLNKYTAEQNRRHDVRPGITGWVQVNGRQHLLFSERLKLDVWYVDHRSFILDIKILAMSVLPVLRGSGVESGQDIAEIDDLGFAKEIFRTGEAL